MKATLRRIATFLRKPQNIILILLVISLAYLVVWPLVNIFQDTFLVHPLEVSRVKQEAGTFTTYHWTKVFASSDSYKTFVQPLINSVVCATLSCTIAILVGGLFFNLYSSDKKIILCLKKSQALLCRGQLQQRLRLPVLERFGVPAKPLPPGSFYQSTYTGIKITLCTIRGCARSVAPDALYPAHSIGRSSKDNFRTI